MPRFRNFASPARPTITIACLTRSREDPKLACCQPETSWFNARSMDALASFTEIFAGIREGDGTLLDNMLIFAGSETSFARIHSVDNIPVMTFGKAGGRIKTGLHIVGNGDPITRIGLTMMEDHGRADRQVGHQVAADRKSDVGEILSLKAMCWDCRMTI